MMFFYDPDANVDIVGKIEKQRETMPHNQKPQENIEKIENPAHPKNNVEKQRKTIPTIEQTLKNKGKQCHSIEKH